MARSASALLTLCLGTLACGRRTPNAPRGYALASVSGYQVPVSLEVAGQVNDSGSTRNVLPCGTWITDGVMLIDGDSAWSRSIREIDTCSVPPDTLRDNPHGPLRVIGDSVQLKLDRTGFVYERGSWRGDSIILLRGTHFGDAYGPPLRWMFAATMRPRPNDR